MTFLTLLATDEFKSSLTQMINDNVNIPLLSEQLEGKIISALIETLIVLLAKLSNRADLKQIR